MIRYFAYGSNMLHERLQSRVPSARIIGPAELPCYRLRFNKISQDGSAKANIVPSPNSSDVVHGVLYEVEEAERPQLDRAEGGYEAYEVKARTRTGEYPAFTYVAAARTTSDRLKPYVWYKELVVTGAKQNGLPAAYIRELEAAQAVEAPVPEPGPNKRAGMPLRDSNS